jgi:hypothetical protein
MGRATKTSPPRSSSGECQDPGIEVEDLTRDLACGEEECGESGHFGRVVEHSEQVGRDEVLARRWREAVGHCPDESAREERVDADSVGGEFMGEGSRESVEGGLGGGVGGLARATGSARQTGDAQHVGNRCALEQRQEGTRAEDDGADVRGEGFVPVLQGGVGEKSIPGDAGNVDEGVEMGDLRGQRGGQSFPRDRIGDVEGDWVEIRMFQSERASMLAGVDDPASPQAFSGNGTAEGTGSARDQHRALGSGWLHRSGDRQGTLAMFHTGMPPIQVARAGPL